MHSKSTSLSLEAFSIVMFYERRKDVLKVSGPNQKKCYLEVGYRSTEAHRLRERQADKKMISSAAVVIFGATWVLLYRPRITFNIQLPRLLFVHILAIFWVRWDRSLPLSRLGGDFARISCTGGKTSKVRSAKISRKSKM